MQESNRELKLNREFARAVIVEALHRGAISECDALDLAFEANGNHGDWTLERVDEHLAKIDRVAQRRLTAKVMQEARL